MSTQPHVSHHEHYHHANFEHVLAGLQRLKTAHREGLRRMEREHAALELQTAALVRELQQHADARDARSHSHEGGEDHSHHVAERADSARHYFRGALAGTAVAAALGVYFAVNTTREDSILLLSLGSAVVAVAAGILMHRRPAVYHERQHHLFQHAGTAEGQPAREHVDPPDAGHGVGGHDEEEGHHAGHPSDGHTAERRERPHEVVGH